MAQRTGFGEALAAVSLWLLLCATAEAQTTTGTIIGTARDTARGPLPGAAVQPVDQLVELWSDLEQGEAASRDNTLLYRRPGGVNRIFDQLGAALLFDRRGTAREDHRCSAG